MHFSARLTCGMRCRAKLGVAASLKARKEKKWGPRRRGRSVREALKAMEQQNPELARLMKQAIK